MDRRIGQFMLATAALHEAVGIARFARPLKEIRESGFVDALDSDPRREAALWYLVSGAALAIGGDLARSIVRQEGRIPPSLGWGLLGIGLAGATVMPRSGFWLLIPQGLLALRTTRATGRSGAPARR